MNKRFIIALCLSVTGIYVHGQNPTATTACKISGAETVFAGSTAGYKLGPCSADSWTASCGTVTGQTSSGVTINCVGMTCNSLTITATMGGVPVATKQVTVIGPSTIPAATLSGSTQEIGAGRVPVTLTASLSTGGNCGGSFGYRWLSSTDSVHFIVISGANAASYQPGSLNTTTWFKRQTVCGADTVSTANVIKIIVRASVGGIPINPSTQVVNASSTPSVISLTLPDNTGTNVSLQWMSSPDPAFASMTPVPGATSTIFTSGSVDSTTYFKVALIRGGDTVYSAPAVVTVFPALYGGAISPASQTAYEDSIADILTISGVTGGNGMYTYQWYSSTDSSTWSVVDGVTSRGYTPGAMKMTTWYRVVVTCNGISTTSSPAIIKVD